MWRVLLLVITAGTLCSCARERAHVEVLIRKDIPTASQTSSTSVLPRLKKPSSMPPVEDEPILGAHVYDEPPIDGREKVKSDSATIGGSVFEAGMRRPLIDSADSIQGCDIGLKLVNGIYICPSVKQPSKPADLQKK